MSFDNKVVLITGGSAGIGRAAALAFAQTGASVVLGDVNDEGGKETVQLIEEADGTALYQHCDVRKASDIEALVKHAVDTFGGLHIALNNAGVANKFFTNVADIDEENYDFVMDINVKGVWLSMKYEIPAMIARGGGSIINLASAAGLVGSRGGAIYSASKHAVIGLTKSAALEYNRQNIRVNAVCPSFVETSMVSSVFSSAPQIGEKLVRANPMKRLGQPEEVASAILWLASDGASFVNGIALPTDGGLTAV